MPRTRYTIPTRYDIEPYGTLCKVAYEAPMVTQKPRYEYYLQTNEVEIPAEWIPLGDVLQKVFGEIVTNEDFLKACLKLLKHPEESRCFLPLFASINKKI